MAPPKPPRSGYDLFRKEHMSDFTGRVTERMKGISEKWAQASTEGKKQYNDRAAKEKKAYGEFIAAHPALAPEASKRAGGMGEFSALGV